MIKIRVKEVFLMFNNFLNNFNMISVLQMFRLYLSKICVCFVLQKSYIKTYILATVFATFVEYILVFFQTYNNFECTILQKIYIC